MSGLIEQNSAITPTVYRIEKSPIVQQMTSKHNECNWRFLTSDYLLPMWRDHWSLGPPSAHDGQPIRQRAVASFALLALAGANQAPRAMLGRQDTNTSTQEWQPFLKTFEITAPLFDEFEWKAAQEFGHSEAKVDNKSKHCDNEVKRMELIWKTTLPCFLRHSVAIVGSLSIDNQIIAVIILKIEI
jgi:hypothetical protein